MSAIPDPAVEPTITVERAAELCGLSRNSAYSAVQRGEIPSLRFNRRVVVPTAPLLRLLGISGDSGE